ncbi:MAG: phosphohydrolase, partial [Saprospiraceae bacterium]
YWQVYLHKTVLSAEQMLIQTLRRAKMLRHRGIKLGVQGSLNYFLENTFSEQDFRLNRAILLERFTSLDDTDIASALKYWQEHFDPILSFMSKNLITRRLFKLEFMDRQPDSDHIRLLRQKIEKQHPYSHDVTDYLLIMGKETNTAYSTSKEEIQILLKSGEVKPMSLISDHGIQPKIFTKHYLCYPKDVKI